MYFSGFYLIFISQMFEGTIKIYDLYNGTNELKVTIEGKGLHFCMGKFGSIENRRSKGKI